MAIVRTSASTTDHTTAQASGNGVTEVGTVSTTGDGQLVVAVFVLIPGGGASTFTSFSGGGLTWTTQLDYRPGSWYHIIIGTAWAATQITAQSITATFDAANNWYSKMSLLTYSGVDQASPVGTSNSAVDVTQPVTITLTGMAADSIAVGGFDDDWGQQGTLTAEGNTTIISSNNNGTTGNGFIGTMESSVAGANTIGFDISVGSSMDTAIAAIEIKAASGVVGIAMAGWSWA